MLNKSSVWRELRDYNSEVPEKTEEVKEAFEEAKKEYEFWTTGGHCEPGSPKWGEVVAKYNAARDAYDFALREQTRTPDVKPMVVSPEAARRVFVIHGRDSRLRSGMFDFLYALGLQPLEWSEVIQLTGKASPYIGEVLDAAFNHAQAVVVLLTPDDEARLREKLIQETDPEYERTLTGQARPNVLFEAGMAFASHPTRTVLVEIGHVRPFSDIAGRHVVKMDSSTGKRQELAFKLRTAGCTVDMEGTHWHTAGDLTPSPVSVPNANNPSKPNRSSKLREQTMVIVAPVSRSTSHSEYFLQSVDDLGAVIRTSGGTPVRVPKDDYIESRDEVTGKQKLLLTRKYFQGYFPGHEHAEDYFLRR